MGPNALQGRELSLCLLMMAVMALEECIPVNTNSLNYNWIEIVMDGITTLTQITV